MRPEIVLDEHDLAAEREALALTRFRENIGKSSGLVGTAKNRTRHRSFQPAPVGDAQREGHRTGLWKPAH